MTHHTTASDGGLVPNTNRNDRHHDLHFIARHRRLPQPPSHPSRLPQPHRDLRDRGTGAGVARPLVDHTFGDGLGEGPGQLIWILLPVGAAMMLRWRGGDGFGDAGIRRTDRKNGAWYLLSSSFYPVVMTTAAVGGLLIGDWDTYDDWAPLRFVAIALVALLPFTLTAIAEEFGWHGSSPLDSTPPASADSPTT